MIDINLPLELEDGTPVVFKKIARNGHLVVDIPSMPYDIRKHTERVFYEDGTHVFIDNPEGIKLKLRNAAMKLVDVNKPVIVGGKEAKIIHIFDNGNLAVIVDGWAEVQNYNQYGQHNGEGCIILRNVAEQTTSFYCIWNDIGLGSPYPTKEAAEAHRANSVSNYAGTLKLTLVDGVATSAEIV